MLTEGAGALNAYRNANSRAKWAHFGLKLRIAREPRERARLEQRRDKADAHARAWSETLATMGINPHAKVKPPKVRTLTYDPLSEWDLHAPVWEEWAELAPAPPMERYRLMEFAGYERLEIDEARRLAQRAGKAKREFILDAHAIRQAQAVQL
jgi:hypothetical protein